ncbi:MAG: transposase [Desulfobacteraceae bacterium]|nr:transposase [Desulfobacteraceae bacterium]
MGRSRYKIIEKERPHFVTCTTVNWTALFSSQTIVGIILDSLTFFQDNQRMKIYAYVIMEHHIHLILSSQKLSKEIGIFKSFTARKIIDFLEEKKANHILKMLRYFKLKHKKDREYQLWQEGSHPKAILNEDMMIQKIEYIHNNPVKCGYVDRPEHWRYSSARNYLGMDGVLEISRF